MFAVCLLRFLDHPAEVFFQVEDLVPQRRPSRTLFSRGFLELLLQNKSVDVSRPSLFCLLQSIFHALCIAFFQAILALLSFVTLPSDGLRNVFLPSRLRLVRKRRRGLPHVLAQKRVDHGVCRPRDGLLSVETVRILIHRTQSVQHVLDVHELVCRMRDVRREQSLAVHLLQLLIRRVHGQTVVSELDAVEIALRKFCVAVLHIRTVCFRERQLRRAQIVPQLLVQLHVRRLAQGGGVVHDALRDLGRAALDFLPRRSAFSLALSAHHVLAQSLHVVRDVIDRERAVHLF